MRLIDCLATTDELTRLFSDESVLESILEFEAALARVEARLGIMPLSFAEKIGAAAQSRFFDAEAISKESQQAGTPILPLIKALRERVYDADPSASSFVHWGATSQDAADTALVLLLKRAQPIFDSGLSRLKEKLLNLADRHAKTVMLGRTLMQPAPPITFGLKTAGWLAAIHRSQKRLDESFAGSLILQFGGASGTLAFLGDQGILVGQALAGELGLAYPEAPWHAHRDRLAALICACGMLTGTLGKMARDISLLMQDGIAEIAEASEPGRAGSSTMPHKHNPVGCTLALAAANRVPGLVSAFLSQMIQEHERGAGGWQAEWPTVAATIQATGLAVNSMADVIDGLAVDAARMRSNIDATHGTVFAEKAMLILSSRLGREAAHKLLRDAGREAVARNRHLSEILTRMPEIERHLDARTLNELEVPELYLGVAEEFRTRLLSSLRLNPQNEKE